jgi:FixJ family two-component response regulator
MPDDLIIPPAEPTLTEREIQVVQGIADGRGAKGVAEDLDLSPLTVKRHLLRIKDKARKTVDPDKIDVSQNSGLVFYALVKGWIE